MFLVLSDVALRWDDQVDADLARTWWLHPGLMTYRGRGHLVMASAHDEAEVGLTFPRKLGSILERTFLYSIPR